MGVVYEECAALHTTEYNDDGGAIAFDQALMFQCLSDRLETQQNQGESDVENWLLVLAGALVFFMQAGFAMLCAGCVRKKNVQNSMLKNLLDACGAALAYYSIGYAFTFGGEKDPNAVTFIGTDHFFLKDVNMAHWFYQFAFSAASVTIVAGTLAERCQMAAYFCYSVVLTGFVYPVVAHAIWSNHGFLSAFAVDKLFDVGCVDFAGSGVVHLTGGTTALMATWILGARRGRFTDSWGRPLEKPREFPGHSIALQLMGTMTLWFGWYGFNAGSALLLNVENKGQVAALVAANTTLSAAAGAISGLFTHMFFHERKTGEYSFSLTVAMNSCLSALVAITAPCGTVESGMAVFIGIVASWIYIGGSQLLLLLQLDDAVDAIPVHMLNGIWGLLAAGLLSSPNRMLAAYGSNEHVGWFYEIARENPGDLSLLMNQIFATGFIVGWVTAVMLPFFIWLNYMGWFRSDSLEEIVGLDLSYHAVVSVGGSGVDDDDEVDVKEGKMRALVKHRRQKTRKSKRQETTRTSSSFEEDYDKMDIDDIDDTETESNVASMDFRKKYKRRSSRSFKTSSETVNEVDEALGMNNEDDYEDLNVDGHKDEAGEDTSWTDFSAGAPRESARTIRTSRARGAKGGNHDQNNRRTYDAK